MVRPRNFAAACVAVDTACGGDVGGPPSIPSAAIAYVEGATTALVTPGRTVVLEGYGFGAVQGGGTVSFARQGGGTTPWFPIPRHGPSSRSRSWSRRMAT
jgi:hypothetical protein